MNNLSWFIYLAEVLPNVRVLFGFAATLGALALFGWVLGSILTHERDSFDSDAVKKRKERFWEEKGYLPPKWAVITLVSLAVAAQLVPSTEAIYLIAGSEVAEVIATSESGQGVIQEIHEVILHQLSQLRGEPE